MALVGILLVEITLAAICQGLQSVVDTATTASQTTFVQALQQAIDHNLLDLSTGGPYTVLVPSNEAFAKLPQEKLQALLGDDNKLREVLKYHVVQGEIFSWGLSNGRVLHTINGHDIRVFTTGSSVYLNNAKVIRADLEATNAVLHVVDTVLDVPLGSIYAISKSGQYPLTGFTRYLDRVHLNTTLDRTSGTTRYTVFAPSDEAFGRLSPVILDRIHSSESYVRELIYYHIHVGTLHLKSLDRNSTLTTMDSYHTITVTVDTDVHLNRVAALEEADIDCDNGVIHIIDHVLIPSSLGSIIG